MDNLDLPTFVPSVGVLGLLVYLVIHLMRQASGDRGGYQQAIIELRQQHAAELTELTARHDEQIANLRNEISILRAEVADLKQQIEEERKARHAAEDQAVYYRRLVGGDEHDEPPAT